MWFNMNIIHNLFHIDQASGVKLPDADRRILFDFQEPDTRKSWMFRGLEISSLYNNIILSFEDILQNVY